MGKHSEFHLEELETVKRILINFVNNNSVEVNSDNRNVPHILKVGSKKKDLQDITSTRRLVNLTGSILIFRRWMGQAYL